MQATDPGMPDRAPPEALEDARVMGGTAWSGLAFERPLPVLSSAPVGGGEVVAARIVNLCVDGPEARRQCDDPAATFAALDRARAWQGLTVGMMTGVPMARLGSARHRCGAAEWLVLATAGTSNAHRAGRAPLSAHGPGTINVIAYTPAGLTAAARAEALMLVTEARCALLADLGVASANGQGVATGTGTDAIAVASGIGDTTRHTGYHTDCGHCLVRAVQEALRASLEAARRE